VTATTADSATTGTTPVPRRRRWSGSVTSGVLALTLAAVTGSVFGLGAGDRALSVYDAHAWLPSQHRGELGRVNALTGRVDTRMALDGTRDHAVQVTQTDRYLIVRDLVTGQVRAIDLATLQVAATLETPPGLGVTLALSGRVAYLVDAVGGSVRQLDPLTLQQVGQPLAFRPGLRGGEFDADGTLWLAEPGDGTAIALTPAAHPGAPPSVVTRAVAPPSHDLTVSTMDHGLAVLDETAGKLSLVSATGQTGVALPDLAGAATLPTRTTGDTVAVTVPGARRVLAVRGGSVRGFTVPGSGTVGAAVPFAGWFYCPDPVAGQVYVLDGAGHLAQSIHTTTPGNPVQLDVRENHLFINQPQDSTAFVVDDAHQVKDVPKYPGGVPGAPVPSAPPSGSPGTEPAPGAAPPPPPGPPGPPGPVVATAGNASAHVRWGPAASGGSPILRYVVTVDGRSIDVGAGQLGVDVSSLTNGVTYRFGVAAVNALGTGPVRISNPVVPTAAVPDPPASVGATANPDGSVTVTWPAAKGGGRTVVGYQVTAVDTSGTQSVGTASATSLTVPAGRLRYGAQYAFQVVAVNDVGAGSAPSPASPTVVPYTVPGTPTGLRVAAGSARGTVDVSWQAPADNGRPIQRYQLTAGGRTLTVNGTGTTWPGFGDAQPVSVTVAAVNAAGTGPASAPATATTIGPPTVAITGGGTTYTSLTVTTTVNTGGSPVTCTLSVAGGGTASGPCASLTVTGLALDTAYPFTVTASNAAGRASATGNRRTQALFGTIACKDTGDGACTNGVGIYSSPMQDTGAATNWNGHNGVRYEAYCQTPGGVGNQQTSATLHAGPYNNFKTSSGWVRIGPSRYVPWVWLNLDNGDRLGDLPRC
jgi:hypothetical protein